MDDPESGGIVSDPYLEVAAIATNPYMRARVAACAAQEGDPSPENFSAINCWRWAAAPGWGTQWASALASGIVEPGLDPAVITDLQILACVQAIRADQATG